MGVCPECGREHKRSKTGPCPRCAMRAYRATEEGRRRTREANARWQKKWWESLTTKEKYDYNQRRRENAKQRNA